MVINDTSCKPSGFIFNLNFYLSYVQWKNLNLVSSLDVSFWFCVPFHNVPFHFIALHGLNDAWNIFYLNDLQINGVNLKVFRLIVAKATRVPGMLLSLLSYQKLSFKTTNDTPPIALVINGNISWIAFLLCPTKK